MSLQFPQDQLLLSKREKQEIFKRSLDDQRRMKQEASAAQQPQLPSNAGNQGRHVPGLAAALPDAVNVPRLNHIPGLDQQQAGYAPRFEGSPSPQQEKQPYMSAVSGCSLLSHILSGMYSIYSISMYSMLESRKSGRHSYGGASTSWISAHTNAEFNLRQPWYYDDDLVCV